MPQIVVWGTGDTVTGRFKPSKPVGNAAIASGGSEDGSTNYKFTVSAWNMGGVDYGGFSHEFSWGKRLRLIDLIYSNKSFLENKNIIFNGAPNFGNSSMGFVSAVWTDLDGAKYYSVFGQTDSPEHFFEASNLLIEDLSNQWIYYNDLYRDGFVLGVSQGQTFNYSFSSWNSSGIEYGSFSGTFSVPVSATVLSLSTFRGAASGGQIIGSSTFPPSYPYPLFGYLGIKLLGSNDTVYIALIAQWDEYAFTALLSLTSQGFSYHHAPWSSGGGGGDIFNPSDELNLSPYEGGKRNPFLGSGCAIAVTYTDNSTQQIPLSSCPAWARIEDDQACPEGSCECVHGSEKCCFDPNSGVLIKKIRLV